MIYQCAVSEALTVTSLWGHVIFFHKQTDVETVVSISKRRHWHDEVE